MIINIEKMFTFKLNYFLWFLVLLVIEMLIATFVHDRFIRPIFGDVLVVILIYTFLKSFLRISVIQGIISVLVFSFAIEISQLFHLIEVLGLEYVAVAHWVLGSSFSWWDFVAYLAGLGIVYFIERYWPGAS